MGLTYRSDLNRPLNNTEIDNNFRYFTGSHDITGSLTVSGSTITIGSNVTTGSLIVSNSLTIIGSNIITGSFIASGSSFIINNNSGSVLTPTASLNGIAPTFNGVEGQFLFGSGSQGYKLFVWMGGAWRSGSLS
jgi:hypothetical protein